MNRRERRRENAKARQTRGYTHRLTQARGHLPSGGLRRVLIAHDADCPFFAGADCRCLPDITVRKGGLLWQVDEAGNLHAETLN